MKKILLSSLMAMSIANSATFLDANLDSLKSIQSKYGIKYSTFKKFLSNCYDLREVSDNFKIVINSCLTNLYAEYNSQSSDKFMSCRFIKQPNGSLRFQTNAPDTFPNFKIISLYGFIPDLKLFENLITYSTIEISKLEMLINSVKIQQEKNLLNSAKLKITEKRDSLNQSIIKYIDLSNKILFRDQNILKQLPKDFSVSRLKELISKINPKDAKNNLTFEALIHLTEIQEILK